MSTSTHPRALCFSPSTLPSHVYSKVFLLYLTAKSPLYHCVSHCIAREVCAYISCRLLLSRVSMRLVTLLDPVTGEWIVDGSSDFPGLKLSSSVYIGDRQVFACGGLASPKGTNKFLVSNTTFLWSNGALMPLPDMPYRKVRHALAYEEEHLQIYAFGGEGSGNKKPNRLCAMFDLVRRQWTCLPEMLRPRSRFNTSQYRHLLYLCGGGDLSCEIFDLHSQSFSYLAESLSVRPELSYVSGDTLVVLGYGWEMRVNLEGKQAPVGRKIHLSACFSEFDGSVQVQNEVFIAMNRACYNVEPSIKRMPS